MIDSSGGGHPARAGTGRGMNADRCPEHPDALHDSDEGCLHGWTDTLVGCPWRPTPKPTRQPEEAEPYTS